MRRFKKIVVPLLLLLVGGVAGYLVGSARAGLFMRSYLLDANAQFLASSVKQLALLRTNRVDECIDNIEKTLDNSIVQLSASDSTRHLPALQVARTYLNAGYEDAFSTQSRETLSQITPIEEKYCSPALRELQEAAANQGLQLTGHARDSTMDSAGTEGGVPPRAAGN